MAHGNLGFASEDFIEGDGVIQTGGLWNIKSLMLSWIFVLLCLFQRVTN